MAKTRLDALLVDLGLVSDRDKAMRYIMAGQVKVDGQLVFKPAAQVQLSAQIDLDYGPKYVSRGGEKLSAALDQFKIDIAAKTCADIGASTGGFTDCLLQRQARLVYAIDVGSGILDWKLRRDPHVKVMENTNVRTINKLPSPVEIVTVDVSFISLNVVLPVISGWFSQQEDAPIAGNAVPHVIILVKPQFEADRGQSDRGRGIIKDSTVHKQVLRKVLGRAQELGFQVNDVIQSPLLGAKGNREFLAWLSWPRTEPVNLEPMILQAVSQDTSS